MKSSSLVLVSALVFVLVAPVVFARPPHRQKRVSDQRLGELEALLALKKLRGKLVTVPVAFGQINPNDYGRKRRSAPHSPSSHVLLERLLEALPQDDVHDALGLERLDRLEYDEAAPAALEALQAMPIASAYERERPAAALNAFNRPLAE
ncbi:uncharacterized protein LOC117641722 [Thrips palmi]|uniref:Uncharacterized protein LOC117641722 n=1 Tax=Thrips palmi TaxID=161013 RepID=A0A6P8YFC0_THRPL|nr:uncharacterized protein LOC117641722 [Thrips palmi]